MDLIERRENMRWFFDTKSDGYDEVHAKFMGTKRMLTDALPEGTARVLDMGAGTGLELIRFFERFPEARVTALDISTEMLAQLKARPFADKVDCVVGDFFEADLGEGYDAVISTSALHHFFPEDKVVLYRRLYDCLKEGGLLVNADKVVLTPEDEMTEARFEAEKNDRPHVDTPLAPETDARLLKEAGFREVTVSETDVDNYRLFVAVK